MKCSRTLMLGMAILLMSLQIPAASRLEDLAARLVTQADDLAAESYRGFARRDRGTRADVDALYLVRQFSASAALFRMMVADQRPESELRDSVAILSDSMRGVERYSFGRRQMQDIMLALEDLSRELSVGRPGRDNNLPGRRDDNLSTGRLNGRMRWQGTVDDEIQIFVQGSEARTRVITGGEMGNGVPTFTSALPRRRAITVELASKKGRGSVEIIQQPSSANDFTAVIRIKDPKGGSSKYEFEILW